MSERAVVQGYIFPITLKQAEMFNFFVQSWNPEFTEVTDENDVTCIMMLGAEKSDMKCLCDLLLQPYKPLVTIKAKSVKRISF